MISSTGSQALKNCTFSSSYILDFDLYTICTIIIQRITSCIEVYMNLLRSKQDIPMKITCSPSLLQFLLRIISLYPTIVTNLSITHLQHSPQTPFKSRFPLSAPVYSPIKSLQCHTIRCGSATCRSVLGCPEWITH